MKISKVGVQIVDGATLRGDTVEAPCVKVPQHPFRDVAWLGFTNLLYHVER